MAHKIIVKGGVGNKMETPHEGTDRSVTKFNFADQAYKRDENGAWVKDGDPVWHEVVTFGEHGENLAAGLKPGNKLEVTGRQELRAYIDKQGEAQVWRTIVVQNGDVHILSNQGVVSVTRTSKSTEDVPEDEPMERLQNNDPSNGGF